MRCSTKHHGTASRDLAPCTRFNAPGPDDGIVHAQHNSLAKRQLSLQTPTVSVSVSVSFHLTYLLGPAHLHMVECSFSRSPLPLNAILFTHKNLKHFSRRQEHWPIRGCLHVSNLFYLHPIPPLAPVSRARNSQLGYEWTPTSLLGPNAGLPCSHLPSVGSFLS
jgi:hypothetical protein